MQHNNLLIKAFEQIASIPLDPITLTSVYPTPSNINHFAMALNV